MKKISFYRFRNSDYIYLLTQVLVIFSKFTTEILESLGMEQYRAELSKQQSKLSISMDRSLRNPYTQKVADADDDRDDEINALKLFLLHCLKRHKPELHPSAQLIINALKDSGWNMHSSSYSKETKQLRAFISKVEESTKLTEAMQLVGATEIFNDLKKYQDAFDIQYNLFIEAETEKDEIDPKEEKEKVRAILNEMVFDLNYLVKRNPTPEVLQIEEELAKALELMDTQFKSRSTRAQNGEENELEEDEE